MRGPEEQVAKLEVLGDGLENSRRKVVISKAWQGYHAYRDMLHYYAVKNLLDYVSDNPGASLRQLNEALSDSSESSWVNLGGQLVTAPDLERLLGQLKSGEIDSWPQVHQEYDRLWNEYPLAKQRHAYSTLLALLDAETLSADDWRGALQEGIRIQEHISEQVYQTRKKDFDNPFRQSTFETAGEMEAVLGNAEGNSFVKQVSKETAEFAERVESLLARI